MPHPPTLTKSETEAILSATAYHPRDHVIYSLALGTGLRLAEIVGLNVGDVFAPDGTPRSRVRIRPEIAKGGRAGDVFLPDALVPKLRKFWAYKRVRGEGTAPGDPLICNQSGRRIQAQSPVRMADVAEEGRVRRRHVTEVSLPVIGKDLVALGVSYPERRIAAGLPVADA